MKLKTRIKRWIGKPVYIEHIVDSRSCQSLSSSYSGGSLAGDSVFLITDSFAYNTAFRAVAQREQLQVCCDASASYQHVVIMTELRSYQDHKAIAKQILDMAEHLAGKFTNASICVAVMICTDDLVEANIIRYKVECMIRVMAIILSKKGVVCNGLYTDSLTHLSLNTICNSIVFLCSRYGQVMDGHVIALDARG